MYCNSVSGPLSRLVDVSYESDGLVRAALACYSYADRAEALSALSKEKRWETVLVHLARWLGPRVRRYSSYLEKI